MLIVEELLPVSHCNEAFLERFGERVITVTGHVTCDDGLGSHPTIFPRFESKFESINTIGDLWGYWSKLTNREELCTFANNECGTIHRERRSIGEEDQYIDYLKFQNYNDWNFYYQFIEWVQHRYLH